MGMALPARGALLDAGPSVLRLLLVQRTEATQVDPLDAVTTRSPIRGSEYCCLFLRANRGADQASIAERESTRVTARDAVIWASPECQRGVVLKMGERSDRPSWHSG